MHLLHDALLPVRAVACQVKVRLLNDIFSHAFCDGGRCLCSWGSGVVDDPGELRLVLFTYAMPPLTF